MARERLRLVLAFASVYLIWGSTYLTIRWGIETIPPFLMAGVRFVAAGVLLVTIARLRGAAWPTMTQWRTAAVVGVLLLTGGNGGVTWSELRVPSGLAALVVGAVPLWIVLLDWLRPAGSRPGRATILGILTGLVGVAILVNPAASDTARIDPVGAAALLVATLSWAAGSIYSRHAPVAGPLMSAGANMLCGGAGLFAMALLMGEPRHFAWHAVSTRSLLSLIYLIVFGAVVGFTAYVWLLRHTTPAKATTYAYVNPVVAVFLGWLLADEPITPRVLVAAAVIIAAVITITAAPALRVWLKTRKTLVVGS
jgi:drug/metabolite transporter (DMT)-like permease